MKIATRIFEEYIMKQIEFIGPISKEIFHISGLDLTKKLLLGFITNFKSGMTYSNNQIGDLLNIRADSVSKIIGKLEKGGYIIRNKPRAGNPRSITIHPNYADNFKSREKQNNNESDQTIIKENQAFPVSEKSDYYCDLEDKERFQKLIKVYPSKKVNKLMAWEVFHKLKISDDALDVIIRQIKNLKLIPSWNNNGGQYIPQLHNWLIEEKWLDEYGELIKVAESWY